MQSRRVAKRGMNNSLREDRGEFPKPRVLCICRDDASDCVGSTGSADYRQFAREKIRPTEAINLTRVWAAEQRQDDSVPLIPVFGKHIPAQEHSLAGATAHQHERESDLLP